MASLRCVASWTKAMSVSESPAAKTWPLARLRLAGQLLLGGLVEDDLVDPAALALVVGDERVRSIGHGATALEPRRHTSLRVRHRPDANHPVGLDADQLLGDGVDDELGRGGDDPDVEAVGLQRLDEVDHLLVDLDVVGEPGGGAHGLRGARRVVGVLRVGGPSEGADVLGGVAGLELGHPGIGGVEGQGDGSAPGRLARPRLALVVDADELVRALRVEARLEGLAGVRGGVTGGVEGRSGLGGEMVAGGAPVLVERLAHLVVPDHPEEGSVSQVVLHDGVVPVEHGHGTVPRVERRAGDAQGLNHLVDPRPVLREPAPDLVVQEAHGLGDAVLSGGAGGSGWALGTFGSLWALAGEDTGGEPSGQCEHGKAESCGVSAGGRHGTAPEREGRGAHPDRRRRRFPRDRAPGRSGLPGS